MTNKTGMTNTELQAALLEAVETSNRYFEEQSWSMSEYWGLVAEAFKAEADRRSASQAQAVS